MATLEFGKGNQSKGIAFLTRLPMVRTIFYVKNHSNSPVYVLYNGEKVTATKSWHGEIFNHESFQCFGDALYFPTNTKKIYKATFQPPNEIRITFIREVEEEETCHGFMLISRKVNGKEVIYRPCDDPKNGIIVDVEEEKLRGCGISAIHRGKQIYMIPALNEATAINLSPNIIVVNCGRNVNKFANDDSPLVYFCPYEMNSCSLFVLDTTTMEIFTLKLPRPVNNPTTYYLYYMVGVHGGEITVGRFTRTRVGFEWEETFEICKAKFPESLKNFEKAAVERDQRYVKGKKIREGEEDQRFGEVPETRHNETLKQEEKMNQFQLRMDALEREVNILDIHYPKNNMELKRQNNELKDQLNESNGKYKKLLMMVGRNK